MNCGKLIFPVGFPPLVLSLNVYVTYFSDRGCQSLSRVCFDVAKVDKVCLIKTELLGRIVVGSLSSRLGHGTASGEGNELPPCERTSTDLREGALLGCLRRIGRGRTCDSSRSSQL